MAHRKLKHRRFCVRHGVVLAGMLWVVVVSSQAQNAAADPASAELDPLAARGYQVTSGAAPGYVEDRVCGSCHTDLYESYQEVSMSQAFYRPRQDKVIEDFEDARFFHSPSLRHYEMARRDGRYVFRRYQLDPEDRPINVFEQAIDWILGSGVHARTYLYRTPGGELYQLPVAWYTQSASWGMAPGYDRRDHDGVLRQVRRECMFCHNAYPDVPLESDALDVPHTYPEQLPEGLGCQRCHGPGAEHARIGMREPVDFQRLSASIVNPENLSPDLRRDICYGCHMQPAVAIDSVRRFGRGDYSFRPGEALADYQVVLDMVEAGKDRAQRFEINHHPYRLEQSRCFVESEGTLSCQTCHDPHRKVAPTRRVAHYRAACQTCHEVDACRLAEMVETGGAAWDGLPGQVDPGDCVACHMQERRPQDATRLTMTDHFIRRRPGGAELLAAIEEDAEPVVVDIKLLSKAATPGPLGEVYRATAAVRAGGGTTALDWLGESLESADVAELDPYFDLARGYLEHRRSAAAAPVIAMLLERSSGHPWALEWSAVAKSGPGRPAGEAFEALQRAVRLHPEQPQPRLQLGRLLIGLGRPAEAVPQLQRAIEVRPNMVKAHFFLGEALVALGRLEGAVDSYRRVLEIEPSHSAAYMALAGALRAQGDRQAALRTLRHGARVAAQPEALREALAVSPSSPEGK